MKITTLLKWTLFVSALVFLYLTMDTYLGIARQCIPSYDGGPGGFHTQDCLGYRSYKEAYIYASIDIVLWLSSAIFVAVNYYKKRKKQV